MVTLSLKNKVIVIRDLVMLKFLSNRKLKSIFQIGILKKTHSNEMLFKKDE
jgi:hypothetical protein